MSRTEYRELYELLDNADSLLGVRSSKNEPEKPDVACDCCHCGLSYILQMARVKVYNVYDRSIHEHWVCFNCLRSVLHCSERTVASLRASYRLHYNKAHFSHLVDDLNKYCLGKPYPPSVRRFLECMGKGVEIPPGVLSAVVGFIARNK